MNNELVQIASAIKHTDNSNISYSIKAKRDDSTATFTISDGKIVGFECNIPNMLQVLSSIKYGTPEVVMPDVTPYLD